MKSLVVSSLFVAAIASPCLSLYAQTAPAPAAQNRPVDERRKAMNDLFHDFWEANLKQDPEFASVIGDKRYNDKVTDRSVSAFNQWIAVEQDFLLKLASIDTAGFTDQEKISHDVLMFDLTDDIESAEFKPWETTVNQMDGIYSDFPQLVAELSFSTVKDYDDWIARLHAIPKAFDQVTTNLSLGMEDKNTPPKFLLAKVLPQVKQLAGEKPEESALALPLKSFPASIPAKEQQRIREEMLTAIGKEVLPTYNRFARFMEVSYIPAGRTEPGIWAAPEGAKQYRYLIRHFTTTDLAPEKIHQTGLDEVKKDEAEMLTIAQKLGFADLKSFRASLKTNPKNKATSAEALLSAYRGYLTPMQKRLPDLFGHLPKSPFEVVPVPSYREKTAASAYYEPGTPDGSRPGRLFVNTYDFANRPLDEVEATAYHEGLPGHHMQNALAMEQTGVPDFRKFSFNSAYGEGWALYAERLGKDVGLYQDPISDFGRLEGDIWRAIRLVVDTGVHEKHWTREQMVQYFRDHCGTDENDIQTEVDRYIAWPGQALAYKVGQLKILELRDQAKKELGAKFDIRAFHDQVLDSGALPLDTLQERVNAWIAAQKSAMP